MSFPLDGTGLLPGLPGREPRTTGRPSVVHRLGPLARQCRPEAVQRLPRQGADVQPPPLRLPVRAILTHQDIGARVPAVRVLLAARDDQRRYGGEGLLQVRRVGRQALPVPAAPVAAQ